MFHNGQVAYYDGMDENCDFPASYVKIVEDASREYKFSEAPKGIWVVEFPFVLNGAGGPLQQDIRTQFLSLV